MIRNYFPLIKRCSLFLIIALMAFISQSYAQMSDKSSNIGASPSAASMVKSISTDVNQYTGVPNIGVDLTILKARGFSIPINLNYNATGIKVQDISSTVGLNWTISTNSLITRIVRGSPDEESGTGYFGSDMGARINEVMDVVTLNAINKGQLDAEPDLFYYNINGVSGKFVFDKDKKPVMLQDNGLMILNSPFKRELGFYGWILSDLFGNQFHLGNDATSIESTVTTILGATPAQNSVQSYTSSWYLKKIITSNNIETVNYNYETGSEIKTVTYNKSLSYRTETKAEFNPGQWPFSSDRMYNSAWVLNKVIWDSNIEDVISLPKYLTSITSSDQSAFFSYDLTGRMDLLNGRVLRNVEIKNHLGDVLQSFSLNQSTVKSKDLDRLDEIEVLNEQYKNMQLPGQQCCPSMELYQDCLNKINYLRANADVLTVTEYDNYMSSNFGNWDTRTTSRSLYDQYRMQLDNVKLKRGEDTPILLYKFEYNQQNIPPRYSKKTDHWGYINNNSIKQHFSFSHNGEVTDDFTNNITTFDRGTLESSKSPNGQASQTGIISKIIYSTGGYKKFSFEQNNYYNNNTNVSAGGLRIAKIIIEGGYNTLPLMTNFYYNDNLGHSTGKLLGLPSKYITSIEHNRQLGMYQLSAAMFDPAQVSQLTPPTNTVGCLVLPTTFSQNLMNSFASQAVTFGLSLFQSNSMQMDHTMSPYYFVNFNPLNNISDLNGNPVGYSQVTIDNNGEGKIVNRFTDIIDYPDEANQFQVDLNFKEVKKIGANASPFTPRTSYDFARGYLKESLVYDKNGALLKKITNEHTFNSEVNSVRGFRCAIGLVVLNESFQYQSNANTYFNVGYYSHVSKKLLLTTTKEESFEPGQTNPITSTISYTYHPNYPTLLKTQSTLQSDGISLTTKYKYVVDRAEVSYPSTDQTWAAHQLFNDRRYGELLEQTIQKGNITVGVNKLGYKTFTIYPNTPNYKHLVLPHTVYRGNDLSVKAVSEFNKYDEFGNVVEKLKKGSIKQSTKYGYNNLYPVAEASNASLEEFYVQDFEELTGGSVTVGNSHSGKKYYTGDYTVNFTAPGTRNYKLSYWYQLNGAWKYSGLLPYITSSQVLSLGDGVDDIRIFPEDAELTTYTYDAINGLTSTTDARGYTQSYYYDSDKKLSTVKDNNGNILKQYCYNTAGEQQTCYSITSTDKLTAQKPFYARLEVSNRFCDETEPAFLFGYADLYIKFYSDAECTIPYKLKNNLKLNYKSVVNWTENTASGSDPEVISTIFADTGIHQFKIGNFNIDGYEEFGSDPDLGTLFWQFNTEFTLVDDSAGNTQPYTVFKPKETLNNF